ncbi:MAG: acyl-CoA thioesterase [Spirochaetales bacterium]|nr:acyl-CoA thioesterase [Spirochaetales bacterium]
MEPIPVRDDHCFCCGKENKRGLKLDFTYDRKGGASCALDVPEWFSGWREMTHGGLLSMLLDEAMAHACISMSGHAITAELTVRFHKPLITGSRIVVEGHVGRSKSRILETRGTVHADGELIASGSARFLLAKPKSSS